jgi:hypothetical protein
VEKLIKLVPHVLPVIGNKPSVPMMSDDERRLVVDELMAKLGFSWDELQGLCQALPHLEGSLRLLQRGISELRERFEGEDRDTQAENDAAAQDYEDQEARGEEKPRYRYLWYPERRIRRVELEFLQAYKDLVVEGLDHREGKRGPGESKGTPAAGRAAKPRVGGQPVGADAPGSDLASRPPSPGARAVAAAWELHEAGKPVSLRAACRLAKVDRPNLKERYPKEVKAILLLAAPDRTPRRRTGDPRTGGFDVIDDSEV